MKATLPASLVLLFMLGISAATAASAGPDGVVRVTGAVTQPGTFPVEQARTVYAAIRAAGGVLPGADLSRVRVVRSREGQVTARVVDARWMAARLARRAEPQPDPRDVALEASDEVVVSAAAVGPRNVVTRYFKDVPFAEAVESLLKDSGYGYSIDPIIAQQNLKVTASVKNSPVESAVRSISQAAGAQCRIEDNNVVITQAPNLINYAQQAAPYSNVTLAAVPMQYPDSGEGDGKMQTKAIELRNIDPGAVLPLLSNIQGVQSAKSLGRNQLVITGQMDAVAEAEKAVAQIDTVDAYPRPVRVLIELGVSKGEQRYRCRTEEVGPEGSVIPIDLDVGVGDSQGEPGGSIRMLGSVTPSILKSPVDGNDLNLWGRCRVSGRLFGGQFDKSFAFGVSLSSGLGAEGVTLASGSLSTAKDEFEFRVTARAVVEKGRVPLQHAVPAAGSAEDARSLAKLGREQLDRGNLGQASACFARAIELDPNSADAHNGLGQSLAKQGKLDEAIIHLNRALTLEPSRLDYQRDLDEAVRLRGVPLGPEKGN